MTKPDHRRYRSPGARWLPNAWDLVALLLVLGLIAAAAVAARGMAQPLSALQTSRLSLDPKDLPTTRFGSTFRMMLALIASILFTLVYGTVAARSRRVELLLIPILDILQSVPILGFSRSR